MTPNSSMNSIINKFIALQMLRETEIIRGRMELRYVRLSSEPYGVNEIRIDKQIKGWIRDYSHWLKWGLETGMYEY